MSSPSNGGRANSKSIRASRGNKLQMRRNLHKTIQLLMCRLLGTLEMKYFQSNLNRFGQFLDGFHGKAAGLATLRKLVAESGSNLEIEEYIEQVESRAEPYHMKKALDLFCKHELGPALDSDTIRQCSLAREIMATKPLRLGCFAEHPGLCKCKHEGERPQVQQFMKLVPNKSCLLRFCVGNLVAYARCILGNMSAPDSTGSHLTRIFDGLMKFCGEEFRGLLSQFHAGTCIRSIMVMTISDFSIFPCIRE